MSHTNRSSTSSFRPCLESLEQRLVPTTANYVNSVYVDLLRRTATAGEVAAGAQQINTGLSPFQFAVNLINGQEFEANDVYNDYGSYLNRVPQPSEVAFWLTQRSQGVAPRQEAALILGSPEFFLLNNSNNTTWLNTVYNDVLGRAPDAGGQAAWLAQLNAGVPRSQVAFSLENSPEGNARTVAADYIRVLQRQPEQAAVTFWTAQMNAGLSPSLLLADLASSPEYLLKRANGGIDSGVVGLTVSTPGGVVSSTNGGFTSLPFFGFGANFATPAQLNETFRTDFFTAAPYTGSLGG